MPTAAWSWRRARPSRWRPGSSGPRRSAAGSSTSDGTPAAGIRLQAYGSGKKLDNGRGEALTGADGRYEMMVNPDEAYAVYVEEEDWAATSRLDVIVRRGKPAEGVDFTLTRGTLLRGTVSVGDGNKPAAGVYIRLDENGGPAPEEFRDAGDKFTAHEVRRQFGVSTDAAGHYSIRVGPGTYTLMGPPRTKDETMVVKDETELVRDFRMPRPEKGPFAGRVVRADDLSKGVAGARVEVVAAKSLELSSSPDGRFRRAFPPRAIARPDHDLCPEPRRLARRDRRARGRGSRRRHRRLADRHGDRAAARRERQAGREATALLGPSGVPEPRKELMSEHFAPKVVTDESGRFTLPSLVVGQDYHIAVRRENRFAMAGMARPRKPGPMDLGTLQVARTSPARRRWPRRSRRSRRSAPDAGAVAPAIEATTLDGKPLTLEQFNGQVRPARLLGHLVRPVHQGDPHAPGRARGVRQRRALRDGEPERGREDRRAEEVPVEAPAPLDPGFPRRRHPRADARQVRHPGDPRLRPGRPRRQGSSPGACAARRSRSQLPKR